MDQEILIVAEQELVTEQADETSLVASDVELVTIEVNGIETLIDPVVETVIAEVGIQGPPGPPGPGGVDFDALPAATNNVPTDFIVKQDGVWVRALLSQVQAWIGAVVVTGTALLTESGDRMLAENGDVLQVE